MMISQPRLERTESFYLLGMHRKMSVINMQVGELWVEFGPRRKEIKEVLSQDAYSVEVYPDLAYFENFDPTRMFEKWATVRVSPVCEIPFGMEMLVVPDGAYAVFTYRGKSNEAPAFYQKLYNEWLPRSDYELENRPHFSVMSDKYIQNHPDSEEELWVPVKTSAVS